MRVVCIKIHWYRREKNVHGKRKEINTRKDKYLFIYIYVYKDKKRKRNEWNDTVNSVQLHVFFFHFCFV